MCSPTFAAEAAKKAPAQRNTIVQGERTLEVVDMTPRFIDFYQAAAAADRETRWALWNEKYGFAAVPPTPEGMKQPAWSAKPTPPAGSSWATC
jgi:hypothetical protein